MGMNLNLFYSPQANILLNFKFGQIYKHVLKLAFAYALPLCQMNRVAEEAIFHGDWLLSIWTTAAFTVENR